MESTIKKLHQLQLMALSKSNTTLTIDVYNIGDNDPYWDVSIHYWFENQIKSSIYVKSHDTNANHRIDMMLKHRILEK